MTDPRGHRRTRFFAGGRGSSSPVCISAVAARRAHLGELHGRPTLVEPLLNSVPGLMQYAYAPTSFWHWKPVGHVQ